MLGACALKWGQLDNVTTALVHLLNKHEHLPGPIAECAAVAADRHENARLAAALLREVGNVGASLVITRAGPRTTALAW